MPSGREPNVVCRWDWGPRRDAGGRAACAAWRLLVAGAVDHRRRDRARQWRRLPRVGSPAPAWRPGDSSPTCCREPSAPVAKPGSRPSTAEPASTDFRRDNSAPGRRDRHRGQAGGNDDVSQRGRGGGVRQTRPTLPAAHAAGRRPAHARSRTIMARPPARPGYQRAGGVCPNHGCASALGTAVSPALRIAPVPGNCSRPSRIGSIGVLSGSGSWRRPPGQRRTRGRAKGDHARPAPRFHWRILAGGMSTRNREDPPDSDSSRRGGHAAGGGADLRPAGARAATTRSQRRSTRCSACGDSRLGPSQERKVHGVAIAAAGRPRRRGAPTESARLRRPRLGHHAVGDQQSAQHETDHGGADEQKPARAGAAVGAP